MIYFDGYGNRVSKERFEELGKLIKPPTNKRYIKYLGWIDSIGLDSIEEPTWLSKKRVISEIPERQEAFDLFFTGHRQMDEQMILKAYNMMNRLRGIKSKGN